MIRNVRWDLDAGFPFLQSYGLLLLAVVLALAAVALFYRSYADVLPKRMLVALSAMRMAALALLILLLFRPIVRYDRVRAERPRVSVLVDDSLSMSVRDVPGLPDRLGRVRDYLSGAGKGRLADLGEDFAVELWAVGEAARRLAPTDEVLAGLAPAGRSSLLGGGLSDVLKADRDDPPLSKVILFSDGVDTSGRGLGAEPGKLQVPVYCIGVGSRLSDNTEFRDVAIQKVDPPRSASVNTLCETRAYIEGGIS